MAKRKDFLTADEVMDHLRVGRTFVYEQARLYLASGGAEGLPCRRFGRLLRFPLDELEAHGYPPATVVELDEVRRRAPKPTTKPRNTARRATGTDQSSLPFTS